MQNCRFGVIADTHYSIAAGTEDSSLWNRQLMTHSRALAESLVELINSLNLDFVIHAGDLTHNGDEESLRFALETFKSFSCPCYPVVGDHDCSIPGARLEIARSADENLKGSFYEKYLSAGRFIFLDSCYGTCPAGITDIGIVQKTSKSAAFSRKSNNANGVYCNQAQPKSGKTKTRCLYTLTGEETETYNWLDRASYSNVGLTNNQLVWLKTLIAEDSKTPTFLTLHHPIAYREEYPKAVKRFGRPIQNFPPKERIAFAEDLIKLIFNTSCIKAVFNGHWHLFDIFRLNNVHFIQTGSLIEYPFKIRTVELKGREMSLDIHSLPLEDICGLSLQPEWESEWVKGNESGRTLRLKLRENERG